MGSNKSSPSLHWPPSDDISTCEAPSPSALMTTVCTTVVPMFRTTTLTGSPFPGIGASVSSSGPEPLSVRSSRLPAISSDFLDVGDEMRIGVADHATSDDGLRGLDLYDRRRHRRSDLCDEISRCFEEGHGPDGRGLISHCRQVKITAEPFQHLSPCFG